MDCLKKIVRLKRANQTLIMKQTIITALLALVTIAGQAQTSFDSEEGCLNVVDVSYSQGIGEYGDGGIAANYLHEKFINDCFSIGAGIGYSYHQKYQFSAIPIYISTHYFFLDRKFSPFVNLRAGGFILLNKKNATCKVEKVNNSRKFCIFVPQKIICSNHGRDSQAI